MANRSLGTLTIDLIAKTGGFVQGMDQAERKSRTWRTAVINDIGLASKSLENLEFVTKDTAKVQETLTNATQGQKAALATLVGIVDNTSNSLAGLGERQRAINTLFGMNAITTQEYVKLTTATDAAKNSLAEYEMQQQQMARAQSALVTQFQALRNQLDPTAVAFERIAEQQNILSQAKVSGLVSSEDFVAYTTKINEMREALEKTAYAATAAGQAQAKAAREAAAADQQAAAAKSSLISKLQEQINTFGLAGDELLRYQAAQLGISKTAAPLIENLSRLQAEQKAAAEIAEMEAQAQREAAAADKASEAAKASLIATLKQQVETYGMSRAELLEYKAAQLGITESTAQLIASMKEQEKETEANRVAAAEVAMQQKMLMHDQMGFTKSVIDQAEAIGKTRSEFLEWKAAQLGVSQQMAPFIAKLRDQEKTMDEGGVTVGQYRQAMRLLPMQITDVVTSLASGMPIWLIAIQQGGQIRDSFNGIGNALKGLVSLINPITLGLGTLAVIGGGLAIAFKEGEDEMKAYNQAIITTGEYAGVSANQLADMAKSISSSTGTTANAAKALTAALNTGAFDGGQLKLVAQAAVAMESATGKSIDNTIAEFKRLAQDPVKASEDLNDQYHYLTASIYEQITALERHGDTQQAAAIAVSAYASAELKAANDVKGNLGDLQTAWDYVARAAKGAWDAMLDIGRTQTPADRVKEATDRVNNLKASLAGLDSIDTSQGGMATAGVANAQARFREQLAAAESDLQGALVDNQRDARKAGVDQAQQYYNNQAIQATKAINSMYDAVETNAEKRQKEIDLLNKKIAQGGQLPIVNGKQLTYDDMVNQINDKYKDPKTHTTKLENSFTATEREYNKQIALIDTTGKKTAIVTQQQKLASDLATGKLVGLNAVQKKRLEQLAEEVDRLNAIRRASLENIKASEFAANLQKQNDNAKQTLNIGLVGAYDGDQERDRMKDVLDIQREYLAKQDDLQKQYQSGDITKSLYDKETEELNKSLSDRLKIQEDHYKKVDELQSNGTAGFISGLSSQMEASIDLYSNMQHVGAQAFSSLTDMVIQWAETGKLNAKDFAGTFLQSVGSALLSYAAAQVAMAGLEAFTSMVGVPFIGPTIAGPAAIAAAAAAGVLALGVGSALKGQAHDGLDSVPETGTWLLQRGERVVTSQTSAKLDATLERVNKDANTGANIYSPTINIPINGNPSDATIALTRKAVAEGAKQGYQRAVNSVVTGQGDLHRALMAKTNAGRKKQ
ncbi:phage tail tape measure protein [Sodalis ligni]|uniref:Lambda family phage tail tape measure protein n=1 Tax=Sodalis ligni TaxID=2697027 RepID=A0A4R1NGS3_9GAMM|nr:phage tail tape measure protein [Sodalis ligni]TCL06914.1 lambda family phage tail tape measure protein [Sodalis ligni]